MSDQLSSDADAKSQSSPARQASLSHFRWAVGLAILILGILTEWIVWTVIAQDRTHQVMYSMPVLSATALATTLWWLFFSGLDWLVRGGGVLMVAAAFGVFRTQYRFEGFDGAMFPRFVSQSEPTREERLDEFLANTASAAETPPSKAATDGNDQPPIDPIAQGSGSAAEQPVATAPRLLITDADWPEYRGPLRDGVVRAGVGDIDWTQTPEEIWRHPVGAGWSSFAVADGRVFTQEQRGERECVVCYDVQTGRHIWEHADNVRFEEAMGGIGPRATPTLFDSRVYTVGASGQLNCLDALTGNVLWATNILTDAGVANIPWAMAGSPLITGIAVITAPGGSKGLIAYDRISGEPLWHNGNHPASYAAPMLATLGGVEQILWYHGDGLSGHAIDGGDQLWDFEWHNDPKINAAQPMVVDESNVIIGSGYATGVASINVGKGTSASDWTVDAAWTEKRRFKLKFNAAVRLENYAYGLDEGILECIDIRDGKMQWKRGRYGYGQLLLAGDVLIVQTEDGDVAYVRASSEEFEELLRFPALSATTWNHPVLWKGLLLVRNAEEAVCFRLGGS
jgi:outer membrane protein assembly factor BamB